MKHQYRTPIATLSSPASWARRFLPAGAGATLIFVLVAFLSTWAGQSLATSAPVLPLAETIDATLTDDTYVSSAWPDQSFGGNDTFYIYNPPGADAYTLLQFSADAIPSGATIVSATLTLYLHEGSDAGGMTGVIKLVTPGATWDEDTVTWNNQPSTDPAAGQSETTLNAYTPGATDVWDITGLVQYAVDSTAMRRTPQLGVTGFLIYLLEQGTQHSQEWYSKEKTGEPPPKLEITYASPVLNVGLSGGGQALCAPITDTEEVLITTINISVDALADWQVDTISLGALGMGNDQTDVHKVILRLGSGAKLDEGTYSADDGSITLNVGQFLPAGGTLTLNLYYQFEAQSLPLPDIKDFQVETKGPWVNAEPDPPDPPGTRLPVDFVFS